MTANNGCCLVIFGATGDLSRRKLLPSLFNLLRRNLLPDPFVIVAVSRHNFSHETFRNKVIEALEQHLDNPPEKEKQATFLQNLYHFQLEFGDLERHHDLASFLKEIDQQYELQGNYLFYLATLPRYFSILAKGLGEAGLARETDKSWRRIVVEKPVGYDLESARKLNGELQHYFNESQIYRIDHYLGKETVQNLLAFRFANGIFEPLWNRNYVHHVEITSAEHIGVENRGEYYDSSGALRDMVQNHILQLVTITAMEPPSRFTADAVRNEKVKVLESLCLPPNEQLTESVVFGQYMGSTIRGEKLKGYREEKGVPPDSRTETFVAIKFHIDNWRWAGVPFLIRTGKRLPSRVMEIAIHFRKPPQRLFLGVQEGDTEANLLVLRIQPDEGILLKFGLKSPGAGFIIRTVGMDFHYSDLTDAYIPAAYERLLLDAISGDATLFARRDEVEASWAFLEPILRAKSENRFKLYGYPAGTWGPPEASALFEEGEDWRYPCKNLVRDGEYCEL